MRRPVFRTSRGSAVELFTRAHHVHLASTDVHGAPVVKTLHVVVDDDVLAFHAAPVGEKVDVLGREAVVTAIEVVAQIPSYFTDAERACPATTLYRSAQAHGTVTEIAEPERKARILRALLRKFQPEGGFAPLEAESPLYAKAIAGLLVAAVRLDRVDGKSKLMQHKKPADRAKVVEALFRRGDRGDCEAIEAIVAENPGDPVPALLRGPAETTFCLAPGRDDARAVARMLAGTYWNDRFDEDELARAHTGSSAWVLLRAADGAVVASARAVTDGVKHAWVYDVIVAPELRGQGVGAAVMERLLAHPAVRGARFVHLGTRDAQPFYARLGFAPSASIPRPYASTNMTLDRGPSAERSYGATLRSTLQV